MNGPEIVAVDKKVLPPLLYKNLPTLKSLLIPNPEEVKLNLEAVEVVAGSP